MVDKHHKKNRVIWDLSGTLFKPQKEHLTPQEKADYSLLFLLWSGKKEPTRLDTLALTVLSMLGHQKGPEKEIMRMHTGEPLPELLRSFLAGQINSSEATQKTLRFFELWAPHHIPLSDQQHVRRLLVTLFNPHALAYCMKPISKALDILTLTAARKTNQLYILSNWDNDSFKPFYQKYKQSVLSYFPQDHIVISAHTGYVKPQKEIYQWLIKHHTLDPASCFFIDDQQENIEAAQACGIDAVQFASTKIHEIKAHLREYNLI